MIRWSFVLTRIIIVVAIIALLAWGLGPVANYVTVQGLQSATGAKVEIESASVGLFPPRITYSDFRIADPRDDKEYRDAFRAETIELMLDGDAFLHRRWVARDGKIKGLQIGSRRQSSGHLEYVEKSEEVSSDGPSVLDKLLASATGKIGDGADSLKEELETVKRSKDIRKRWENDYEMLVVRARELEKQIRTIRDNARAIDNPLRDLPMLQQTLTQARDARNELLAVRQAIDALPSQVQADLASLDEAKKIDLAKVNQYVPGDLSEADDFGVDLLKNAVQEQLQRIRGYLDGGRTIANYTVVAPETDRIRGEDFDLIGPDRRPDVLVRRCEVSGLLRADGSTYALKGIVENMTPSPSLLEEPTVAKLQLEGPEVVRVEFVRDRRRGNNVDLCTIHWPQSSARPIQLGKDKDAGMRISGGSRELWVQLRSQGEHLEGRLVSKQTGMKMQLDLDSKYEKVAAVESIQSSLASVDRIEIDANFSGTWKDINLQLHTNLGQVFHRATQAALYDQVAASKAKLTDEINKAHLEQTESLQKWLHSQQGEARTLLASADRSIEEMSEKVMTKVGDADVYLGKLRSAVMDKLR